MENEQNNTTANETKQTEQVNAVDQTISKMRELGLDPNAFVTLFMPVLEQMTKNVAASLRQEMQTNIQQQSEIIGQRIVSTINTEAERKIASMNSEPLTAQPDPTFGAPQPAITTTNQPQQGGRQGVDINAVLPVIMKMMGGGSSGDGGMVDSMKKMAETAKIFGTFYTELMAPMNSLKSQMTHDILSELTTLSKTGGVLPWEQDSAAPAAPRVNLNQQEKDKKIADLAARIRFT
jgi:hypothetical protein